jgi:hypothetical protein
VTQAIKVLIKQSQSANKEKNKISGKYESKQKRKTGSGKYESKQKKKKRGWV